MYMLYNGPGTCFPPGQEPGLGCETRVRGEQRALTSWAGAGTVRAARRVHARQTQSPHHTLACLCQSENERNIVSDFSNSLN